MLHESFHTTVSVLETSAESCVQFYRSQQICRHYSTVPAVPFFHSQSLVLILLLDGCPSLLSYCAHCTLNSSICVLYSTVKSCTIQYSTVQYSTVLYTTVKSNYLSTNSWQDACRCLHTNPSTVQYHRDVHQNRPTRNCS